jgi:hypothetical protein
VTSRLAAATVLVAPVLLAACGADEGGRPVSSSTSSRSQAAGVAGRCDFPPFRPASLPWLEPGQPIPAPTSQDRFEGYAQLAWHAGASYLVLWRVNQELGGPGEPAPPLPNGAEGYLYEGSSDEDIAQWAVVWADVQADGCNQTTLSLVSPRLTKQEGKQEILQLTATLREAP